MSILRDMTQAKWDKLSRAERLRLRDESDLAPCLIGKEGRRVAVTFTDGSTKSILLGITTGWRPCHLVMANSRAIGSSDCIDPATVLSARILR